MAIRRVVVDDIDRDFIKKSNHSVPKETFVDWQNVVVNKPWGYEYLMHANDVSETWRLFIRHGESTSMHCHPRKKTALLNLHGTARFSTLKQEYILNPLDCVIIDAGVFHKTEATSSQGIHVVEIETPPMKHDLIRLHDAYGRTGKPYEGTESMSLHEAERIRFVDANSQEPQERSLSDLCTITLKQVNGVYAPHDLIHFKNHALLAFVGGEICSKNRGHVLYSTADVVSSDEFLDTASNHEVRGPLSMFLIRTS